MTAGGTMTGEIEATTITLNAVPADPATDDKVRIGESGGTSNMFMIRTNDGYLMIGPNNSGYAHIQTDRDRFYFNKTLTVSGGYYLAYSGGLTLGTGTSVGGATTAIYVADGMTEVGVGSGFTSSATATNSLHVKTAETIGDAAYAARFQMAEGNVGTTRYGGIHLDNDNNAPIDGADWSAQRWQIGQRDGDQLDISFGTPTNTNVGAGDTKLRILTDGKVGILKGSTDPAQALDVNGTIRQSASTSAVLVSDANGDIVSATNLADANYIPVGGAETDAFNATAPPDWAGPPPTTITDAINRIAAQLAILGGPIP